MTFNDEINQFEAEFRVNMASYFVVQPLLVCTLNDKNHNIYINPITSKLLHYAVSQKSYTVHNEFAGKWVHESFETRFPTA